MTRNTDHDPGGRARLPAAERRETILRAATEVFAKAGYRAGKVSDVAARVGVTEPVVFQNFGTKASLFAAVLERAAAEVRSSLDDVAAEFGSASGLLAHVLTEAAHGDPGRTAQGPHSPHQSTGHAGAAYGVLFADAAALTSEPELAELATTAFRAIATHLSDLVRRAQADGDVRSEIDPDAAGWLLMSMLSARRLRAGAMPAQLERAVSTLALAAIGIRD